SMKSACAFAATDPSAKPYCFGAQVLAFFDRPIVVPTLLRDQLDMPDVDLSAYLETAVFEEIATEFAAIKEARGDADDSPTAISTASQTGKAIVAEGFARDAVRDLNCSQDTMNQAVLAGQSQSVSEPGTTTTDTYAFGASRQHGDESAVESHESVRST